MPDWRALVQKRLAGLTLAAREKDEVIAEIADHLGETYDELRRNGMAEEEAECSTLATVSDWEDVRTQIQIAKEEGFMHDRVRRFWVPALITYVLSMSLLAIFQRFGLQPWFLRLSETGGFLLYVPWLIVLPLFGALAAYLSVRAGGSLRSALSASAFPVVPYAAFFVIGLPVSIVLDNHVAHNIQAAGFVGFMFSWVLVPGTALLAGGLLAQAVLSPKLRSGRIANN